MFLVSLWPRYYDTPHARWENYAAIYFRAWGFAVVGRTPQLRSSSLKESFCLNANCFSSLAESFSIIFSREHRYPGARFSCQTLSRYILGYFIVLIGLMLAWVFANLWVDWWSRIEDSLMAVDVDVDVREKVVETSWW